MTARDLYLDLLKRTLTDAIYDPVAPGMRAEGRDWPSRGCTMIGLKRLDNLQSCIENVLANGVAGDLIETGVWRGGATIFMRAMLKVDGVTDRLVWVADSFQGLPPPDAELYPADAGDTHHTFAELAVSLDEVKANFERFGMLDDNVRFLKGWFHETLADPRIKQLSVLRLDGDMYGSTMNALVHLYPRLSVGGYIIVDDYGAVPGCRKAVDDFRATRRIAEEMREIDWAGVFWQRRV
jgi:O-methyltransferase